MPALLTNWTYARKCCTTAAPAAVSGATAAYLAKVAMAPLVNHAKNSVTNCLNSASGSSAHK